MLRTLIGICIVFGIAAWVAPLLVERTIANRNAAAGETVAMVSQARPSSPLSSSGRSVSLDADARGHFVSGFRLNGRHVDAMVDTGASLVAINRSTARRIGISLAASDFVHEVNTANGTTRAAAAMIDRLEIGSIDVRDVQAVVLEDEALSGTLIGMSFLNHLRRFQVESGRLLLEQ